jgi:quercetin dioxygenase-like cupin family protein
MSSFGNHIRVAAVICCFGIASQVVYGQTTASGSKREARERARIVLSEELPTLDGKHLKAILVEVNYGAGEASPPHSHPCAVLGYVAEGTIRTQVKGEPEMIYKAGESFYEAPNGVHLVSANASSTAPARLVAYMICDHDTPLSVDVPESAHAKGDAK